MIFQHFNLLSAKTVAENVALPLRVAGVKPAAARARVEALLDMVGLRDKADVYPSKLHVRAGPGDHAIHPGAAAGHQPQAGADGGAHHARHGSDPRSLPPGAGAGRRPQGGARRGLARIRQPAGGRHARAPAPLAARTARGPGGPAGARLAGPRWRCRTAAAFHWAGSA
ncbi:hypothetical protein G6F22_019677 [Rhizopus arrhizus]|nr:hypothetical protein G6F22_019677 [Rhizopus arrhizus]